VALAEETQEGRNRSVQSGVHPINRMTDTTLGDGPAPEATASVKLRLAKEDVSGEIAKKHFDAFETDFFQQGEDGAGVLIDADRFDEGDGAGKNFLLSRQSWRAIAIVSTSVALLACLALWRSNSRVPVFAAAPFSPPVVSAVRSSSAVAPALPVAPVAVHAAEAAQDPTFARADRAPEPSAMAADNPASLPTPAGPAPAIAEDRRALPQASPTPSKAETTPPAPVAVAEPPAPDGRDKPAAEPVPPTKVTAQSGAEDARSRCKRAISGKRSREILDLCPGAFTSSPGGAEIAVALAKVEFDRGRSAQAYAWGKKAIAANPDLADAYVFIGGAEQGSGHGKAAKEAYEHYLRLAPFGRYAADLRAIVNSF
jgi:hypothetical protein